jgi:queuine tRNA-ribosyltransferase
MQTVLSSCIIIYFCIIMPIMSYFDVINTNKNVRSGILNTRVGKIRTPAFFPDGTRGAVKSMTPEQVVSTGVQAVLANTFHLHISPGESVVAASGGIHSFSRQALPIMTDSGGFQIFSLSGINKITEEGVRFRSPLDGSPIFLTPEESIRIQIALGSDMVVVLDDLASLAKGESRVIEAFDRTHRWLQRSIDAFNELTADMISRPLLFGVVQGGLDMNLRKKSLDIVQNSQVDGVAIGGLSVGESHDEMRIVLEGIADLYSTPKPRFLLGVGSPREIRMAIENGVDMMDCVLPTRNARHGNIWIDGDQAVNLLNARYKEDYGVLQDGCDCYTCVNGFSRSFLRHQFKVAEPLAGTLCSMHNIRYLERICESYR